MIDSIDPEQLQVTVQVLIFNHSPPTPLDPDNNALAFASVVATPRAVASASAPSPVVGQRNCIFVTAHSIGHGLVEQLMGGKGGRALGETKTVARPTQKTLR